MRAVPHIELSMHQRHVKRSTEAFCISVIGLRHFSSLYTKADAAVSQAGKLSATGKIKPHYGVKYDNQHQSGVIYFSATYFVHGMHYDHWTAWNGDL